MASAMHAQNEKQKQLRSNSLIVIYF